MSKPNDTDIRPGKRLAAMTGLSLISITALLLQLPLGASAGIAPEGDDRVSAQIPVAPVPSAAPAARASGKYTLRCWQYGKLLFDEGPVSLGSDARANARLVATDRNGSSLFVTDAGGATCLARPAGAAPNPAMQR